MEQEFKDMDSEGRWQNLYIEIRNLSQECPFKVAKYPENRNRNRYRDVSPFDHSRVKLANTENDYINASLVQNDEAQRSYILTQGPLRNTCGHFWLMIWEQKTKAVIMLNRVIEKDSEKCAQYWPTQEEGEMAFRDTRFVVRLLSQDVKSYYTTRVLELQNANMDRRTDPYTVDIKKVLLDMRKYRMGLIQTPDQLRFSFMAVLEGAKCIMGDSSVQKLWQELSKEDQEVVPESPSPPKCPPEHHNGVRLIRPDDTGELDTAKKNTKDDKEADGDGCTANARKRPRDEKISISAQKSSQKQPKPRVNESEKKRKRPKTTSDS
ncbi:tyrosine-protein phosphatase non-receptor type 2 isoform X3 [Trichomycterus rosablanca]|uniref:tyrosine-protein phosphatase non-receptor type 2 isoform X3 n=1 Tax=Trichomycterus rosablanca TaxID=2290929 RepID=UPI002F350FF4